MTILAASDLEGTLTTGETWKGFGRYLSSHGRRGAYLQFLGARVLWPLVGRLSTRRRSVLRTRWMDEFARLFAGMPVGEFEDASAWVVEDELWANRREDVLRDLQSRADEIVVASGTYQPVLEHFARRFGAAAVGTPLNISGNRLTGGLAGQVNTGSAKAERLGAFLSGRALDLAYGDTLADIPILEMAAQPVAVYPDRVLRALAIKRGWRILDGSAPR